MRVAFLGLGLIGGSIARDLREHAGWTVAAWTPAGDGPRLAHAAGVVDDPAETPGDAVRGAALVVLAAPPLECLGLLRDLDGPLRADLSPGVVITDVASTKAQITALADELGLPYVGGHPMAGRETAGFEAAEPGMFHGRPWVIVPGRAAGPEAVARVEALAAGCGARPVRMDAAAHDAAVAGISHLPLIAAAALVEAVAGRDGTRSDWPATRELAAGGWASMTRLARGDVAMGAGISATNATALAGRLRDLRAVLDDWLAMLEAPGGPDPAPLADRLLAARRILEAPEGADG
jgi:prephenate dehydrogenase